MQRKLTLTATIFGMFAIILGAFGAHILKKHLTIDQLAAFETGVKYQMYHALFLLFISLSNISEKVKQTLFYLTVLGVFFFSGSIYLLSTQSIFDLDFRFIGIITPIGGLLLLAAWVVLFYTILKKRD
jgi:uncharacterized membrane protein YgdD (TMEM256/DUF423 family)